MLVPIYFIFFFFSSRRRHTRLQGDWSSDVCSSDLDVWWAALAELRARYARIVGAGPEEIALAPSVSVAVSAVAEALDYRRRPQVVGTSLGFPTVAYQWPAKPARGAGPVRVQRPGQVS